MPNANHEDISNHWCSLTPHEGSSPDVIEDLRDPNEGKLLRWSADAEYGPCVRMYISLPSYNGDFVLVKREHNEAPSSRMSAFPNGVPDMLYL